ncbi:hypothetical protein [Streptomyces sp. PvR018]|uniref:hypothetical protein n=1 Tax=Streptomyces sp. PvR018 TaxID=3156442 RepID=UPI0033953C0B
MIPLLHADKPESGHALIPATEDMRLRKAVEIFGKCFYREMGFDFPPFEAEFVHYGGELNREEVVLFDSQAPQATFPIAAGAAGLSIVNGTRVLDWIWIHPFQRGKGLADIAWDDLEAAYGDTFQVRGPLSKAMRRFLEKRDVAPERWKRTR